MEISWPLSLPLYHARLSNLNRITFLNNIYNTLSLSISLIKSTMTRDIESESVRK